MRSRAVRFLASLLAILALAAVAAYIARTERQLAARHAALRELELVTHEALLRLTDLRSAQQAYVAAGQSTNFWIPKVAALLPETSELIDRLRTVASSDAARRALLDASAALAELTNIDRRARDYLAAEQPLMAADVLFSEARETAAEAGRLIEATRFADQQEIDSVASYARRREATAAASAAGFAGVLLLWLAGTGPKRRSLEHVEPVTEVAAEAALARAAELAPVMEDKSRIEPEPEVRDIAATALEAAARVSTEFGCIQNTVDLKRVLGRAAEVLDASGLVVWLGSANGGDLRPVLAHGYSDQVLALMRSVPRQADNAAAAAYRTAALQIVPAKPGTSLGAVVAPIVSADGCIGALTAEIKDNGEISETVHAVATIFASQLAGVLAASAQATTGAKAAAS